jgi:nucleotide-binding universal stress UspA family protein
MTTILHPTRGGEASYPNQDRAIAIAKKNNAHLIFLYVTDIQFLNRIASQVVPDVVAKEIDDMGDFLLAMAQERAQKECVEVSTIVMRGVFSDVLQAVIVEHEIDTLILGSSTSQTGHTTLDYLKDLSQEINAQTNAAVLVLSEGKVAYSTSSIPIE